ncbi:MAG: Ornithine carbamoyltransferase ArgF [Candidatus Methanohalarchaeum thermophilum]|uniref:Ornithine carbamoyltransferase n=1 Tax=Methanohalarchaeum thermophilum TaxID=1903181 RepID=A0A1Q6DS50_METT1|nr:MAG: Ornithine carbamoyltransferase ArgF [Candidatus Methanohalarchaeum thermophilum]
MDLLKITNLGKKDLKDLLKKTDILKEKKIRGKPHKELESKSVGLLFEEPSTRTRISFSVGCSDLGMHSLYLKEEDLQIRRGENIKDTGNVISRYLDSLVIRALDHQKIKKLAQHSTIPIINAMSKKYHPCQAIADLYTIKEKKDQLRDLKFAWIGDANNVCNSNILGNSMMDIETRIASPKGYEPEKKVIKEAQKYQGDIKIFNDPYKAVEDSDIIYTDVWISTGDDRDPSEIKQDFKEFKVTQELVNQAKPDAIVMHCMPIKGNEITREVVESTQSVIYDQAENRLHTEKALLLKLLKQN